MSDFNKLSCIIEFYICQSSKNHKSFESSVKKLKKSKEGKLIYFLYKVKGLGELYFFIRSFFKYKEIFLMSDSSVLVHDHSSGIIRKTFKLCLDADLDTVKKKVRPIGFIKYWSRSVKAYFVLRKKLPNIDNVILYSKVIRVVRDYVVYGSVLDRLQLKTVLLADTSHQDRVAIGAVANEMGIPVITFSVSMLTVAPLQPFQVSAFVCWSKQQADFAEKNGITAHQIPVYKKPLKVRQAQTGLVIGIFLNSSINEDGLLKLLDELIAEKFISEILIRPHPGSKFNITYPDERVKMSSWQEPLAQVFESVDYVIVPSSNVAIDSLLAGVPVVYTGMPSTIKKDVHNLVYSGLVIEYDTSSDFWGRVASFYTGKQNSPEWLINQFSSEKNLNLIKMLTDTKGGGDES